MWDYLIAILVVPVLLVGWLLVQQLGRNFARTHPEFGAAREEGSGCGKSCACSGNSCQRENNQRNGVPDGQDNNT